MYLLESTSLAKVVIELRFGKAGLGKGKTKVDVACGDKMLLRNAMAARVASCAVDANSRLPCFGRCDANSRLSRISDNDPCEVSATHSGLRTESIHLHLRHDELFTVINFQVQISYVTRHEKRDHSG